MNPTHTSPPAAALAPDAAVEDAPDGSRLFAPPPPAGGCASGECLPDEAAAPPAAPAVAREPAPAPAPGAPNLARGSQAPAPFARPQGAPAAPPPTGAPPPSAAPPAPANRAAAPAPAGSLQASQRRERWSRAVQAVRQESGRHGASLMHGRLLDLAPGRVRLGFTRAAAFHRTAVAGSTGKALIEKALTEHFGQPTVVEIEPDTAVADAAEPSLAEFQARAREAHERSTDSKVRNHPAVMAALSLLGGQVEHIQVLQQETHPAAPEEPSDD